MVRLENIKEGMYMTYYLYPKELFRVIKVNADSYDFIRLSDSEELTHNRRWVCANFSLYWIQKGDTIIVKNAICLVSEITRSLHYSEYSIKYITSSGAVEQRLESFMLNKIELL